MVCRIEHEVMARIISEMHNAGLLGRKKDSQPADVESSTNSEKAVQLPTGYHGNTLIHYCPTNIIPIFKKGNIRITSSES